MKVCEIRRILRDCRYAGLEGIDRIEGLTDEELEREFNGFGPEWFPKEVRDGLGRRFGWLLGAVLVHDLDFYLGDGTMEDFERANGRFVRNGKRLAKRRWLPLHPIRYLRKIAVVDLFGLLCGEFGWEAYEVARRGREMRGGS